MSLISIVGASAIAVLSGCEQAPSQPGAAAPAETTGANAAQPQPAIVAPDQNNPAPSSSPTGATVFAYKLASGQGNADANGLVPVPVKLSSGQVDAARIALQNLAEGPTSPLPKGTEILGVVIDPATKLATVDFSPEFKSNFHGGETEEAQAVNAVLKTLGQFDSVDKVRFEVAGRPLDTLGGAQDLSQPLPTPQSASAAGEPTAFGGNGAKQ